MAYFKKEIKFKPYKIQTAQRLTDVHRQRRLNFSKTFLSKVSDYDSFLNRVIFFDEAYFSLDGIVIRQNNRFWEVEKLEVVEIQLKRWYG